MRRLAFVLILGLAGGCTDEPEVEPLTSYEAADLQARVYNFQVYPGARFLERETETLRKAHFVMQPDAKTAPPMAMYDTDAPLEQVAAFYAEKYGFELAPEKGPAEPPPAAYYTTGDLAADAAAIKPLVEKMKLSTDVTKAAGTYRGAHINPAMNMPRVTLQRPYFDVVTSQVVDRTLILLVK